MDYDKYLEDQRESFESNSSDNYKVWMVFVFGGKKREQPLWYDSEEDEQKAMDVFNHCKTIYDKVELGWVWNNDFDFRNIEKTYRLLETQWTFIKEEGYEKN